MLKHAKICLGQDLCDGVVCITVDVPTGTAISLIASKIPRGYIVYILCPQSKKQEQIPYYNYMRAKKPDLIVPL